MSEMINDVGVIIFDHSCELGLAALSVPALGETGSARL